MMIPAVAFADFQGSDPLAAPSPKWSYIPVGGGQFTSENSKLELVVKAPEASNGAALQWLENYGSYTSNWYLQVDSYLDLVPIVDDNEFHMGIGVGIKGDAAGKRVSRLYQSRYRYQGAYISSIVGYSDNGFFGETESQARAVTMRLHFNKTDKTITGSWNAGSGWNYLPAESIERWGMTSSDNFYALLFAGNSGTSKASLVAKAGVSSFTNFKAGRATPDIVIEQPVRKPLVDGESKRSFGKASANAGRITKIFTIRNSGTDVMTGLKITSKGANPADFTHHQLSSSPLLPGDSRTFKVTFKPRARGPRTATITIHSTDPNNSRFDITLIGTGTR